MIKKVHNDDKIKAEKQIQDITKSIDYLVTEYTVELLKNKFEKKELIIPDYQREFTWEQERQSKFIESILMGLPIPFLFFWEDPKTGVLEIVDGTQRIRTIQSFMNDKLILKDLEKLSLLNNLYYSNLVESRQRKFKNKSIRGIILTEKTDQIARLDLFERINTGSKNANFAEIRRAVLSGSFTKLIIKLSKQDIVKELLPANQRKEKERVREELITRFFAYGDGLEDYKGKPNEFYSQYTEKMNKKFSENKKLNKEYEIKLINVFNFVKRYFPNGFTTPEKKNSVPRVRFESIALGVFFTLQQKPDLKPDKKLIEKVLESEEFKKEIRSDGANSKNRIKKRVDVVKDILLQG